MIVVWFGNVFVVWNGEVGEVLDVVVIDVFVVEVGCFDLLV